MVTKMVYDLVKFILSVFLVEKSRGSNGSDRDSVYWVAGVDDEVVDRPPSHYPGLYRIELEPFKHLVLVYGDAELRQTRPIERLLGCPDIGKEERHGVNHESPSESIIFERITELPSHEYASITSYSPEHYMFYFHNINFQ
jgi:hypothetical protein